MAAQAQVEQRVLAAQAMRLANVEESLEADLDAGLKSLVSRDEMDNLEQRLRARIGDMEERVLSETALRMAEMEVRHPLRLAVLVVVAWIDVGRVCVRACILFCLSQHRLVQLVTRLAAGGPVSAPSSPAPVPARVAALALAPAAPPSPSPASTSPRAPAS